MGVGGRASGWAALSASDESPDIPHTKQGIASHVAEERAVSYPAYAEDIGQGSAAKSFAGEPFSLGGIAISLRRLHLGYGDVSGGGKGDCAVPCRIGAVARPRANAE